LAAQRGQACTHNVGHPFVGNDTRQFLDTFARANQDSRAAKRPLHRTRHLFMRQQTSVINAIRAHLAEFGVTAPVGRNLLLALPTASHIASASVASFFCRLT
jgi:hypothetical protein